MNADTARRETWISIKVADIKCNGLPSVGLPKRPGKYYVKLSIGQHVKTTAVSTRGNVISWNDNFYFDTQYSSVLEVQVYAQRTFGSDDHVGGLKDTIGYLLSEGDTKGATKAVTRNLCKWDAGSNAHEVPTVIMFTLSAFTTPTRDAAMAQMSEAVDQGRTAHASMVSAPSVLADTEDAVVNINPSIDYVNTQAASWDPLLEKIQLCIAIVDRIAEIHPYAKMAWTVISSAHTVFLAQKNRDESISRLVDSMSDAYAFVRDADPLKTVESHEKIVVLIVQQTTECGYFIRDYSRNKGFWERTRKNLLSVVERKVEEYQAKFRDLKSALQERAVIQTEITVLRVLDMVENISAEITLNDMPYAEGARYDVDKGCLPGTRGEVIDEIANWVNSDADDIPRVFLLVGTAGTGKSAIAHSVARLFDGFGRLGSSFCFNRTYQAERRPDTLFSTIARDLSDLDTDWKTSLWGVVQGKKALRTTRAPREQFEKFILHPSNSVTPVGPLLIVIDALDECGDRESRQILLTILANKAAGLPSNFRILVTARAERDIIDALDGKSHVISKNMDTINAASTSGDLSLYVQAQLGDIEGLERKWPNNAWCRLLVEYSEGLFQWASTACRFIQGDGGEGLDPVEQMDVLVSPISRSAQLSSLDQLYTEILMRTFKAGNPVGIRRFKSIIGIVLVAREPLSIASLKELRDEGDTIDAVGRIIRPLGALLSGVTDEISPIRPLHTSFRDFLTDENRCGPFYIDLSVHHPCLTFSSLRVMSSQLRFNICKLDTSHKSNKELMSHHAHERDAITPYLSYACRFYTDHLLNTNFDHDIADQVRDFLHTRLLYWLEVMSLIQHMTIALKALLTVVEWSKDDGIAAFAKDAHKFVATFAGAISRSAPHIYLSALPFAPDKSLVSQLYLPQFPRVLRVRCGKAVNWPAVQSVLEGHTSSISAVACSPDGKQIVSGSLDGTIRVWNAVTGDVVSGPFEGHTGSINSVALSQDGKRIVSGSRDKTIRVWDAETGDIVSGPFEGHTSWVTTVAFSHDGKRIVSGSFDKTVRVWDARTGNVVLGPFEGHFAPVSSVAFSVDEERIVSGSWDKTIRVWDARTGKAVVGPFEGHFDSVSSVAFSADGERILSGSWDKTIRVWDSRTGKVVVGPIEGHTNCITSVAFSRDGKWIVSGSWDRTIRVWDAGTGGVVLGPFKGHAHCVTSVAFSQDGKQIVSGSDDNTIRVQDVATGDVISGPVEGLADCINCVAFSQDGKQIVSGSADTTIRVWDAETGGVVSGPFEGHTNCVTSVAFSRDGRRIVSGSFDRTIRVWDVETGDVVSRPFIGNTFWVVSVAFSQDGKRVVSGSHDMTIIVWNAETGDVLLGPLKGHTDCISSVMFSQDGTRIVSGSDDKTIRLWNAETGDMDLGPFEGHTDRITSVAFSADGKRIASGSFDKSIRVWDAKTGYVVSGPLEGHTDSVTSVAFSPNGKQIVSGSRDKTIRVWDAEAGVVVAGPFEGHTFWVTSVAYSQDGKRVVSGSQDATIRVWDVDKVISTDFQNDYRMESGWILDHSSGMLFWVPIWSRTGLWRPNNVAVMSGGVTKLDFTSFVHGTSWQQCKTH